MTIDSATRLTGFYHPEILDGVYILKGQANNYSARVNTKADGNSKKQYVPGSSNSPVSEYLTLIPYYSWANRSPGEMAVWFATSPEFITRFPEPPGIEAQANGSASYAYDNSIPYLNDGIDPMNSADRGNNAFRLHPHKGTAEWVAYQFDQPKKLSSVKVYWLEDGSYTLPVSWSLSYQKEDGTWAPVDSFSPYLIEKDQYNEVTFVAVTTKGLRIDLKLSDAGPGGIIEIRGLRTLRRVEMAVRYLVCPQCGIIRFQVKNGSGQSVVVQVTRDFEIIPVNSEDSLEGFNLDLLYCLGCSWKGSIKSLKKYL
jgi:hypothetical protein